MVDTGNKSLKYKDREIKISSTQNSLKATIDLTNINISFMEKTGTYSSTLLPYKDYDDPESLIKDIIDHHPNFKVK